MQYILLKIQKLFSVRVHDTYNHLRHIYHSHIPYKVKNKNKKKLKTASINTILEWELAKKFILQLFIWSVVSYLASMQPLLFYKMCLAASICAWAIPLHKEHSHYNVEDGSQDIFIRVTFTQRHVFYLVSSTCKICTVRLLEDSPFPCPSYIS